MAAPDAEHALSAATWRDLDALMRLWGAPEGLTDAPSAAPLSHPAVPAAAAAPAAAPWLQDFVPPRAQAAAMEPASAPRLRCLDDSHPGSCVRCLPPPPVGEECAWLLMGEPQAKNGEKRLRRLLTRTPEWRSPETRLRTAQAVQGQPGMAVLALVMRAKANCGELRKAHLMALARQWGYACDIWKKRSSVKPRTAASRIAAAVAAAAAAAGAGGLDYDSEERGEEGDAQVMGWPVGAAAGPPPWLALAHSMASAPVPPPVVPTLFSFGSGGCGDGGIGLAAPHPSQQQQQWQRQQAQQLPPVGALLLPGSMRRSALGPEAYTAALVPFADSYRHVTSGDTARAAALAHGWSFLDGRVVAELGVSRVNLVAAKGTFEALARAVRAMQPPHATSAGGAARGDGSRPAWLVLAGRELPGESLCVQLAAVSGEGARVARQRLDSARLGAAERAWLADSVRVHTTGLHAATQASVLLRDLQLGPAAAFVPAAAAVLDACAGVCAAGVAGVEARLEWVRQLAATPQPPRAPPRPRTLQPPPSALDAIFAAWGARTPQEDAALATAAPPGLAAFADELATQMYEEQQLADVAAAAEEPPVHIASRFVIHLPPHPEGVLFE